MVGRASMIGCGRSSPRTELVTRSASSSSAPVSGCWTVPATSPAWARVSLTSRSNKNDPNDASWVAIAARHMPRSVRSRPRIIRWCCGCW